MPHVEANGLRFHYQQAGEGPDVVLIHAFTANLSVWMVTGIIEKLAQHFRVTTYDLRGHGVSAVTPSDYTSQHMAGDFAAIHSAMELQPAYVVGHSYGGVIAVHTATQYPQLVKGVVLSDTFFPGLRELEPDLGQAEVWQALRGQLQQCGSEIGGSVDFGRLFRTLEGFSEEQFEQLKKVMPPFGVRWLRQVRQLSSTTAGDEMFATAGLTAERICSITQPVLALYDEHTSFNATRDYLAGHLPDIKIDTISGAKHLAPVENPAEFIAKVLHAIQQWEAK